MLSRVAGRSSSLEPLSEDSNSQEFRIACTSTSQVRFNHTSLTTHTQPCAMHGLVLVGWRAAAVTPRVAKSCPRAMATPSGRMPLPKTLRATCRTTESGLFLRSASETESIYGACRLRRSVRGLLRRLWGYAIQTQSHTMSLDFTHYIIRRCPSVVFHRKSFFTSLGS